MKRNTVQRKLTLDMVKKLHNHPTAEQVYEEIKKTHPTISRGTIYRNLSQLAKDGEIVAREIPSSATHFDHRTSNHYHIICTCCGKVSDVKMDVIPNLIDRVKETDGFIFNECDIVFKGVCNECQKK